MVRVVVLDVDGTLVDTNYLHTEAWTRAFEAVGVRVARVEVHRQIGKGSDQLIKEFVENGEAAQRADELHGEIYAGFNEHGYPLPGARELIDSLHGRGCEVWLATSAKPEELDLHGERFEWDEKIAGIVNSSDVERSKPAPDIFELALERAGASPGETVAVGDSIWDVEAAKHAGVHTLAVLTGGAFTRDELKKAGAVAVYEDCEALLKSGFPEE